MKSHGSKLKTSIGVIIVALGVVFVVRAWRAQSGAGKTCAFEINRERPRSYIQIELRNQDPVEPVFSGELFVMLDEDPRVNFVNVITTGAQGYGDTLLPGEVKRGGRYLPEVGPIKNYAINPTSGSHRLFPFDSARFDIVVNLQPRIVLGIFRVINRVDGFVLDCSSVSASQSPDGGIQLRFMLSRNPLVQLSAIVIAAGSIAFAILILKSKTIEGLSGAAASSFFSMWSVRSILASQIHVFPTLLDLMMLTACIALLGAVFWRVVIDPRSGPVEDI